MRKQEVDVDQINGSSTVLGVGEVARVGFGRRIFCVIILIRSFIPAKGDRSGSGG